MANGLRVRDGGTGRPVLLMLHGMGATGEVWRHWAPLLARRWPGRWIAPDLPGHGDSEPLPRYSFGGVAARVAELVAGEPRVVVLGHSFGGAVGLALASGWFGVPVEAAIGLGIKVSWTDDELAKARALAARPVGWFETRQQAAERYLRVSGLTGLLDPADDGVAAGLRDVDGRWRLAMDPGAFDVGAPDVPGLLAAARGRVVLARGERDPMVTHEQLARLASEPVTLPGLGHNAHAEDPEAVLGLVLAAIGQVAERGD